MSDTDATGFAKFVPGFDFLQNLAKGASASVPQMPNMGNWVAPTLNVEELDKRIEELKNVQFWLEQNSRALSATVQALEVQRMTLVTLKSMNFNLNDLAATFQMKSAGSAEQSARKAQEKAAAASNAADEVASGARKTADKPTEKPAEPAAAEPAAPAAAGNGLGDPLQLWGALTQQFQQIASNALQEVTAKAGIDLSKNMAAAQNMASGLTPKTTKAAKAGPAAAKKAPAKKTAARKPAARKTSSR